MSDDDQPTKVELREELTAALVSEHDDLSGDGSELAGFLNRACREAVEVLAGNHSDYEGRFTITRADYRAVGEMFDSVGVRSVEVRSNGKWHSPTLTVWLAGNPPMWANVADRREFRFSPGDRADYNGNLSHAVIDVRPF